MTAAGFRFFPFPDDGQFQVFEFSLLLPNGEEGGEHFARVVRTLHAVDDGQRGIAGELVPELRRLRLGHQAVNAVLREQGGNVPVRHAHHKVPALGREIQRVPAQLRDGELEGNPQAGIRAVQNDGNDFILQRIDALLHAVPLFDLAREMEYFKNILRGEIVQREKFIRREFQFRGIAVDVHSALLVLFQLYQSGRKKARFLSENPEIVQIR